MDWKILLTVFGVVFVAELPDKTAVATLVLASRYSAWPVFLGSAAALSAQSAIAIVAGRLLAKLPHEPVHIGTAILFLISAIWMWLRKEEDEPRAKPKSHAFARVMLSTFAVVFVAEWGDLTQLATAAFSARYAKPITIFVASTLALWMVSGIAVFLGNRLAHYVKPRTAQRVAAVLFVAVGVAMLLNVF